MNLSSFFESTYRPLRLRGRSESTLRLYGCVIRQFGKWLERPAAVTDVGDELLLAAFLEHRSLRHSPWTVEKERSQLLALARLAFERRLLERMPSCPPTPLPHRTPTSWNADELMRLYIAATKSAGFIGGVSAGTWWLAVISLAYESGERIGALLRCQQSDLKGDTLTVPASARKGRRSDRVITLSAETVAILKRARAAGRPELLWWPLNRAYLWLRLKDILARAGLSGRRVGFHQLRRTGASFFAAAGGSAADYLGHGHGSGEKVAAAWYVDPRLQKKQPAWSLLPRLGLGGDFPPSN
jgi:integrase